MKSDPNLDNFRIDAYNSHDEYEIQVDTGGFGCFVYDSLRTLHKSGLFTIVRNPFYRDIQGLFGNYKTPIYHEITAEGFEFLGGASGFRKEAFQDNLFLTEQERYIEIPRKRIAIAGIGAVGNAHLMTLVEQGIEQINISEGDRYNYKNIQRQRGADVSTVGRLKSEVMAEHALLKNPYCNIRLFDNIGRKTPSRSSFTDLETKTLDAFLQDVDLAIDGIDFYEIDARRDFINAACEKGIPVISAGPVGFGTSYVVFMPEGPNFDKYFNVQEGMHEEWKLLYFLAGIAPKRLHKEYTNNPKMIFDVLVRRMPPSISGAVQLCAGVTALNAVKILFNKGKVKAVPYNHQFDARTNKWHCGKSWTGGNYNPLVRRTLEKISWTAHVDELRKFHEEHPGEPLRVY